VIKGGGFNPHQKGFRRGAREPPSADPIGWGGRKENQGVRFFFGVSYAKKNEHSQSKEDGVPGDRPKGNGREGKG